MHHVREALGADVVDAFHRGRSGPGGWVILFEPELHFGDDVLLPDVAGWRRSRLPEVPDEAYLTLAPDWVCEVLSLESGEWASRRSHEGHGKVRAEPFDAIEIELGALWC